MTPRRKRVLFVEDDDDVCLLLKSLLDYLGYEVTIAQTIDEAEIKIESEGFDLFLLDNWLPGGMGINLCRAIRERYPLAPILFYSGASYDSDREQAIAAGASAYLVKPIEVDKLAETVKTLLESPNS